MIVDPYISHWSQNQIAENLIPLIENLFISRIDSKQNQITLKIFSKREKKHEKINLASWGGPKPIEYQAIKPLELIKTIKEYFTNFNLNIEYTIFNSYFKKEKEFCSKFSKLPNYLEIFFHDRYCFSNYIFFFLGHSFDINNFDNKSRQFVENKETTMFIKGNFNNLRYVEDKMSASSLTTIHRNYELRDKLNNFKALSNINGNEKFIEIHSC